jgi:hypothetical protein
MLLLPLPVLLNQTQTHGCPILRPPDRATGGEPIHPAYPDFALAVAFTVLWPAPRACCVLVVNESRRPE